MIAEKRLESETYLYFAMNEGSRLTTKYYLTVMGTLGFSETAAQRLYSSLMNTSHDLAQKRNETERSILIG